jgi:hypothetical protein
MHDSDGIIISVAPPQRDTMGVGSVSSTSAILAYKRSMILSNRAGGRVYGVDIVMMDDILDDGSSEVATTPPIECPRTTIFVFGGYFERTYSTALDV